MDLLAWNLSRKMGKKIGRNNLYKLLRGKGIIPPGTTVPYTHYILCGWFQLVCYLKHTSSGVIEVTSTKLTQKGYDHFLNTL
jgi:phage antirepressor YoqD-like protein